MECMKCIILIFELLKNDESETFVEGLKIVIHTTSNRILLQSLKIVIN